MTDKKFKKNKKIGTLPYFTGKLLAPYRLECRIAFGGGGGFYTG